MRHFFFAIVLALGLAASPLYAEAAGLTNAQVQAILSILSAFGADQSVIENVRVALIGETNPTNSAVTTSETSLVIFAPISGTAHTMGQSIPLSWHSVSANSTYILTVTPAGTTIPATTLSITAAQAGCTATTTCSHSLTPPPTAPSLTLLLRDLHSNRSGSVTVSVK